MPSHLRVLAVEPWLGGSHERFLASWRARSRHAVTVLGLPARSWKWRMEAAAHTLARRAAEGPRPDAILTSDFVDVARFRGFLPTAWAGVPIALYFHENQLTYPTQLGEPEDEPDLTHGFANALSCAAADVVAFNSRFHLDQFRGAVEELFARLPRPSPAGEVCAALDAARVVPVGVELDEIPLGPGPELGAPLRVVFNHRFEHDKDPVAFLRAVLEGRRRSRREVEVVLLGETYRRAPEGAEDLIARLGRAVVHRGFAPDRREYARWLGSADVVVSTARHEFYGVAVIEAVAAGCSPLAPRRLAYPEVLAGMPLVESEDELVGRLAELIVAPDVVRSVDLRRARRDSVAAHDAAFTAAALDSLMEEVRDQP